MGSLKTWFKNKFKKIIPGRKQRRLEATKQQPKAKEDKANDMEQDVKRSRELSNQLEGLILRDQERNIINSMDTVVFERIPQEIQKKLVEDGIKSSLGKRAGHNIEDDASVTGKINGQYFVFIPSKLYSDGSSRPVIHCEDGSNYEIMYHEKRSSYRESKIGKNGEKRIFSNNGLADCSFSISKDGITYSEAATTYSSAAKVFDDFAADRGLAIWGISDTSVFKVLRRKAESDIRAKIRTDIQDEIDNREQAVNEKTNKYMSEQKKPSYDLEKEINEARKRAKTEKDEKIKDYRDEYMEFKRTDDEIWNEINCNSNEATYTFGEGSEVTLHFDSIDDFIAGKKPKRINSRNSIPEGKPRI